MNQLIVLKAKVILTSTEFNKRELMKYYGNDVGEKTVVVPLGYDDKRYKINSVCHSELSEESLDINIKGSFVATQDDRETHLIQIQEIFLRKFNLNKPF